ncbi:MAG: hypothetical protein ACRBBO_01560 [Cognatishimia sp.]
MVDLQPASRPFLIFLLTFDVKVVTFATFVTLCGEIWHVFSGAAAVSGDAKFSYVFSLTEEKPKGNKPKRLA